MKEKDMEEKNMGKKNVKEKNLKERNVKNKKELNLSTLGKTWIFDLDGTLVKHNGYKVDGKDSLLPGAREYLEKIPIRDTIILLTSRKMSYRDMTVRFLQENAIRYDAILFEMPMGERIVINDRKPSGIDMAVAINVNRDDFEMPEIVERY